MNHHPSTRPNADGQAQIVAPEYATSLIYSPIHTEWNQLYPHEESRRRPWSDVRSTSGVSTSAQLENLERMPTKSRPTFDQH